MPFTKQKRRLAFWCVLFAAVAVGILAWGGSALLYQMIEWHWPAMLGNSPLEKTFLDKAVERVPPAERGSFSKNPEEILAFAKEHPDRPWHLWRWIGGDSAFWAFAANDHSGLTLSERHAEYRRVGEDFEKKAEFLHEMDPDNGWPLVILAQVEARKGIALSAPNSLGRVKDERHADKAVEYLLQAAARQRVGWHERELVTEWQSLLGYKGETLDEALIMSDQALHLGFAHYGFRRDFVWLMLTEAERRASMPEAEETSAYDILVALQTLWAKISLDGSRFISLMSGMAMIRTVTEEGAEILRKHDRPEEAAALLQRGRELIRPWLVSDIVFEKQPGTLSEIYNSPELAAEAKESAEARRESLLLAKSPANGVVLATATPALDVWPTGEPLAPEAFRTESRLEYWAMQKAFWSALTSIAAILLPLAILFYLALQLRFRRSEDYVAEAWPAPGRIARGVLLFGIIAAAPGIAAAFAGNDHGISFRTNLNWLLFCNLWGFLAAIWAALWWAARGTVTPNAPTRSKSGSPPSTSVRKGLHRRLANLPLVALALSPAFGAYFLYRKQDNQLLWSLMEILTLVFAVWAGLKAVGLIRSMLLGNAAGAPQPLTMRLFLAAWAGGLILWIASYVAIDWQERTWAARDTLLIPRTVDANATDSALTSRLMKLLRENMRKTLEKTG